MNNIKYRGGARPGSGRPKKPQRLVREALDRVDQNLPELFESLIKKALEGDREAAMYLIDRRLGKPTVISDIKLKGGEELGQGAFLTLMNHLNEARRRFELQSSSPPVILIEGGEDGRQEEVAIQVTDAKDA